MKSGLFKNRYLAITLLSILGLPNCGENIETETAEIFAPVSPQDAKRVLTLAAYSMPREVYEYKIIPAFKAFWKEKTGEDIEFQTSYLGSGAQSRSILDGFDADIAALSLETDIMKLVDAGLINHNWKAGPYRGIVTRSVVVFGVREGNPFDISDWEDLAAEERKVLTPDVRSSGGAMWNVAALYGAVLRGYASAVKGDEVDAEVLLSRILFNVETMDRNARASAMSFESGVGDVIITYENEMRLAAQNGHKETYVIPTSTILIENPVAVIYRNTEAHGVTAAANAFVSFLFRKEAQQYFAEFGFRPVDESDDSELTSDFPALKDVFTIRDLGGWAELTLKLFAKDGIYDRALATAASRKLSLKQLWNNKCDLSPDHRWE